MAKGTPRNALQTSHFSPSSPPHLTPSLPAIQHRQHESLICRDFQALFRTRTGDPLLTMEQASGPLDGVSARHREASLHRAVQDSVHHLGACGDHRAQLVPVDELCRRRTVMPGQPRDLLHGYPTTDIRDTNAWRKSRGAHPSPRPAASVIFLNSRLTFAASSGVPTVEQNTRP